MRKIQNPLVVLQFDLNFDLIQRYEGGISHAQKIGGYTKESVKSRCIHSNLTPYKNCYWVYEKEYLLQDFSWENYLNGVQCKDFQKIIKKTPQRNSKRICQYDLERNLIHVWESFVEISNAGFTKNKVNTICNQRKGHKIHKGYIWAYEGYDFSDGYFDTLDTITPFQKHSIEKRKKVAQLTKDGDVINIFDSLSSASAAINSNHSNIIAAIKRNGTCCGYRWQYYDES